MNLIEYELNKSKRAPKSCVKSMTVDQNIVHHPVSDRRIAVVCHLQPEHASSSRHTGALVPGVTAGQAALSREAVHLRDTSCKTRCPLESNQN